MLLSHHTAAVKERGDKGYTQVSSVRQQEEKNWLCVFSYS